MVKPLGIRAAMKQRDEERRKVLKKARDGYAKDDKKQEGNERAPQD